MDGKEVRTQDRGKVHAVWGNFYVKAFLFLLTVISLAVMGVSLYFAGYLLQNRYRDTDQDSFGRNVVQRCIWQDYYRWSSIDVNLDQMEYITSFYGEEIALELMNSATGEVIWSNGDTKKYALYTYTIQTDYFRSVKPELLTDRMLWRNINDLVWGPDNGIIEKNLEDCYRLGSYCWKFYFRPAASGFQGSYGKTYWQAKYFYEHGNMIMLALGISAVLFFVSFILLMVTVGQKKGAAGMTPGALDAVPMDIYVVVYAVCALTIGMVFLWMTEDEKGYFVLERVWETAFCAFLEAFLGIVFLSECMNRLKRHVFLKSMIIYRLFGGIFRFFTRAISESGHSMELLTAYGVLTVLEFLGLLVCSGRHSMELLCFAWTVEKLIILAGVGLMAGSFHRIQRTVDFIAMGNYEHKTDSAKLLPGYRKLGEQLNHIAEGMNTAVEAKIKSERLKTELITNVSHDLKTPLTSIINYSELIAGVVPGEGDAKEYAQVLNRQSKRLKKLLEDLLEASKASTGNIEVNLQPCDIGVMLTQCIGEYEDKFKEKGLLCVEKRPDEPVWILADGRHLWRVFDNLLNNICKYSMENSRVYLSLEKQEKKAVIVFRNMSKYEINVSSAELTERFVRGDKSRKQEGNGLGLSIASSLTSIQKGTMEILVDGDLFKVILSFPLTESVLIAQK